MSNMGILSVATEISLNMAIVFVWNSKRINHFSAIAGQTVRYSVDVCYVSVNDSSSAAIQRTAVKQ